MTRPLSREEFERATAGMTYVEKKAFAKAEIAALQTADDARAWAEAHLIDYAYPVPAHTGDDLDDDHRARLSAMWLAGD